MRPNACYWGSMSKTQSPLSDERIVTAMQVLTPALHDGRRGIPAIITLGEFRFASSTPVSVEEAGLINKTLLSAGAKL